MNQDVIERIRERWQKLRLCRHRGTVMTDYRILRNYVRIYQALGETARILNHYLSSIRQNHRNLMMKLRQLVVMR